MTGFVKGKLAFVISFLDKQRNYCYIGGMNHLNQDPMTLRARIKAERILRGLSQSQAAHRLGTSRQNWSLIESGDGSMTLRSLRNVADALQMRTVDLLANTEYG